MVEQETLNLWVHGSSPWRVTNTLSIQYVAAACDPDSSGSRRPGHTWVTGLRLHSLKRKDPLWNGRSRASGSWRPRSRRPRDCAPVITEKGLMTSRAKQTLSKLKESWFDRGASALSRTVPGLNARMYGCPLCLRAASSLERRTMASSLARAEIPCSKPGSLFLSTGGHSCRAPGVRPRSCSNQFSTTSSRRGSSTSPCGCSTIRNRRPSGETS